jgi:hypothetical protein
MARPARCAAQAALMVTITAIDETKCFDAPCGSCDAVRNNRTGRL